MKLGRALAAAVALTSLAGLARGQDVVSFKDLQGTGFREYQMHITINSFYCEGRIGNKCRMTVTVVNKGDKPELFNGTQFSVDNNKGTVTRAVPVEGASTAALKKELLPGASEQFTIAFSGRINFHKRDPVSLRYANTTKVRIIE